MPCTSFQVGNATSQSLVPRVGVKKIKRKWRCTLLMASVQQVPVHRLHPTWSVNSIKTLQKRIRKKMREGGGGEEGEAGEEGALVIGEEGHEDEDAAGTAAEAAAAAAPVVPMMAPLPAMGSGDPLPAAAAAAAVSSSHPSSSRSQASSKARLQQRRMVRMRSTGKIPIAALKAEAQESPGISLLSLGKTVQSL